MKVCIVGASGKLGQYMVRHALDRGYDVVAVCRQKSVGKLDAFEGRITVVPGATNDREVIQRAVAGCDGAPAPRTMVVPGSGLPLALSAALISASDAAFYRAAIPYESPHPAHISLFRFPSPTPQPQFAPHFASPKLFSLRSKASTSKIANCSSSSAGSNVPQPSAAVASSYSTARFTTIPSCASN